MFPLVGFPDRDEQAYHSLALAHNLISKNMQIGPWQFRPKLWPTLAALALFPVLVSLGFWQLDRAAQKEALQKDYETKIHTDPVRLAEIDGAVLHDAKQMLWRHVTVEGVYLPHKQYLLDNQTMGDRAGYLVYTPFKPRDRNLVVLINRGWVPVGPDRSRPPRLATPAGGMSLQGVAKLPPSHGLLLGNARTESLDNGVVRLPYLDLEKLGKTFDAPLLPYVIRLEGKSGEGFRREWQKPGFGREMHLGYAFQWFAMSAALVIIYVFVNLKRNRPA